MAKTREKTEFGDFQTPRLLADAVCQVLLREGIHPATVIEPTCGRGSFVLAGLENFLTATKFVGLEINADYLAELQQRVAECSGAEKVELIHASFFDVDWPELLDRLPSPLLFIGNPPWVTNSQLGTIDSFNLPKKSNYQNHAGLDAITGKSNFDISEWMLIQMVKWLHRRGGCMAMLCKTAVARKILSHVWKFDLSMSRAALYSIDANEYFGAAVKACLLVCHFDESASDKNALVFDSLNEREPAQILGWDHDQILTNLDAFQKWKHLLANPRDKVHVWRSGVKHDCSSVMELAEREGRLHNKLGEEVDLESMYLYPMMKSSELGRGKKHPTNVMIVTQTTVNSETHVIRGAAPKTWDYLLTHANRLDGRKSSIYRNRPRFCVFGIGDYTFAPYKVAISGLYKQLRFEAVASHNGKPVVFDDTVNFLPCHTQAMADFLCGLLNSEIAHEFFSAFIFWDAKRPITVDVLRKLDLRKLAEQLGRTNEYEELTAEVASFGQQRLF